MTGVVTRPPSVPYMGVYSRLFNESFIYVKDTSLQRIPLTTPVCLSVVLHSQRIRDLRSTVSLLLFSSRQKRDLTKYMLSHETLSSSLFLLKVLTEPQLLCLYTGSNDGGPPLTQTSKSSIL